MRYSWSKKLPGIVPDHPIGQDASLSQSEPVNSIGHSHLNPAS